MNPIPVGFCQCGCGEHTNRYAKTRKHLGQIKGEFARYRPGHNRCVRPHQTDAPRKMLGKGYIGVYMPDHPNAHVNGYVYEHILVASRALGRAVPRGAQIHHINGDTSDNRPENLVICPSVGYHKLLHQRQRALEACGHADWIRCRFCERYDNPANDMYIRKRSGSYHRSCRREHEARLQMVRALSYAWGAESRLTA